MARQKALKKNLTIVDYLLSQLGDDERPYLEIKVFDKVILGLLDSGASRSVLNREGYDLIKEFGLEIDYKDRISCVVANGDRCTSLGTVSVPVKLVDKLVVVKFCVIPEVTTPVILGIDFWASVGIVPDIRRKEWRFGTDRDVGVAAMMVEKSDMSPDQTSRLDRFLARNWERMSDTLGCTELVEHEILTEARPIKQRYYPVSPKMQGHINAELDDMLRQDVIEPSSSAWSSPILMVPKKDGSFRFCVDFRKVNEVSKKDAYPIPYVSAILDRLRGAKYLTSLDIKSAYWQIPVAPASREITAFTIPGRGLYQFKRLPFGLSNSPATWQRLIDRVLGADLALNVFVYLDDIIVLSETFEQHLAILEKIFDRLVAAGLTLSREKCQFCRPELHYLGYVVDKRGLRVDPAKVEAILNIPTPKNVSDVRRFLGMCSWYRRFVPEFSTLSAPLCELLP